MMCSSIAIWIQSVHLVKKRKKTQLVLMSPEHCLSEERAVPVCLRRVFGGSFLWLSTVDGCGFLKRLGDFTTLLLLVRWTSFTAISLEEEMQIFHMYRKLHYPFYFIRQTPTIPREGDVVH